MGALNYVWDLSQSGQIDELYEELEKQQKTIEEMKDIMHKMALRIVELEKKNGMSM